MIKGFLTGLLDLNPGWGFNLGFDRTIRLAIVPHFDRTEWRGISSFRPFEIPELGCNADPFESGCERFSAENVLT